MSFDFLSFSFGRGLLLLFTTFYGFFIKIGDLSLELSGTIEGFKGEPAF